MHTSTPAPHRTHPDALSGILNISVSTFSLGLMTALILDGGFTWTVLVVMLVSSFGLLIGILAVRRASNAAAQSPDHTTRDQDTSPGLQTRDTETSQH